MSTLATTLIAGQSAGTLLAGAAAWRTSRRAKRLERDTAWPRLAKAMADNDQLRTECRLLRAECRRMAVQLRAALALVEKLRAR